MKPKEVKGIECPHCNEFISEVDVGVPVEKALETRFVCGECDTVYEDREEAKDCCSDE